MKAIRFSEYFELNKNQAELDFVDIFVNDDIPLYIDPYVFKLRTDDWSVDCNDLIVDFFSTVINAIKNKRSDYAKQLLEQLGEPSETHLGVSRGSTSGKGVSGKQANDLYERLSTSKAVTSGSVTDISDCELMIPGIGFDKVSDITTNIIREKLILYTQEQCRLHGIPMRSIPSGKVWSPVEKRWLNGTYVDLPVYDGKRIILVPKYSVVFKMTLSSRELYEKDIVEYIQAEQMEAMSSLVEVLKNGKRRVTKKSIKEHPDYQMSKEFIYAFCDQHPEVLEQYKERKGSGVTTAIDINDINERAVAESLIDALRSIDPGSEQASAFHSLSVGILEFLFFPHLMYPKKEHEVHDGRKRIDITFNNASSEGFWNQIRTVPTTAASLVMVECKNYSRDIKNPELDQMSGRFSHQRGWFGLIMCRSFDNKKLFVQRCKDTAADGRGVIICLDDTDVISMLQLVIDGRRSEIDKYMVDQYQEVIS